MDELDHQYVQTRQVMRQEQQRFFMEPQVSGSEVHMGVKQGGKPTEGHGPTPQAPPVETPAAPVEPAAVQPREFTVDTPEAQAVRAQYQEQFAKMASGEAAVEAVGRKGKQVAEATRPGFVVAARALGMDENAAEAVGDAFVEFMGGLPGEEESDFRAGIETALAALPVLSVAVKGGKAATQFLAKNKDEIIGEFQKAVKILKEERGSVPLGKGKKLTPEQLKALDEQFPGASNLPSSEVWYHGSDVAGGQAIEQAGHIMAMQDRDVFLTPAKWAAEQYAEGKGGKVFAVRRDDIPAELLEQATRPGGFVETSIPRGMKDIRIPIQGGGGGKDRLQGLRGQIADHLDTEIARAKSELKMTRQELESMKDLPADDPSLAVEREDFFREREGLQLYLEELQTRKAIATKATSSPDEIQRMLESVKSRIVELDEEVKAGREAIDEELAGSIEQAKKGKRTARSDESEGATQAFRAAAQRDALKRERALLEALIGQSGGGAPPITKLPPGASAPGDEPISSKALALISKREESKQRYQFTVEGFQEELTKQRRGPVLSDEAVRKLAGQSGFTLQDLLDLKPGSVLAPEIQVKAREVYKAAVDRMKTSAKAYLEQADGQAFDEFAEAFTQAGLATTRIIGTYSEAGRTFRYLNQKTPGVTKPGQYAAKEPEFSIQDQYIQEMYKFFRNADEMSKRGAGAGPRGMMTPGQLASMVMELPNEEAMMNFAKAALKPTWGDMFYEVWINGLLSGPITHATNIISNTATLLWNIPERQIASLIKPGAVRPGEAAAMLGGVVESIGDAWKLAWKAFKEEAPQFGQAKLETPRRAITADALELTGMPGRAVDFLGTAARLPGRFLMAGDDFFKAIAFRAELRALAKRQAFKDINELGLTGKEAARRAKEIEHRILTDPPEAIKEAAQEFAAYTTFTRELGPAGQFIQHAVQNVPLGRVVLPFIRTPANIFKFAGERTPLALASKAVWQELRAGGERQALAMAKIALGSMTMAYMATLAANGLITGGGPKDKVLRKQLELEGWQPYSFKVGNTYVSFARIEPLGSLIGAAADAADLMGHLNEQDAAELASALTVAISRNVANKTFVKGLAGTLNAATSQDVNVVKGFLEKELPTLLPYSSALGQTTKVVDPVMRDVQNVLDAFKAKVPGYSSDLPPVRNLWGEPVLLQGGMGPDLLSPLYQRDIKNDPVAKELNRLEVPFTPPTRQINGLPLPPKLYDRYAELAGKGSDLTGGKTLRDKMQQTMQTPLYRQAADGPDGGKVTLLKEDVRFFREMARLKLEQENKEFAQAMQQQRMRSATKFNEQARAKHGTGPVLR